MLSEVKCDSDMYTKNMEKCQRKALEVWVMYMKVPRETTDDICFFLYDKREFRWNTFTLTFGVSQMIIYQHTDVE